MLVTLLGIEFHSEILQGKKGYKEELCEQKLEVCIITSSTMAGYKDGDKVMHNIILNMV